MATKTTGRAARNAAGAPAAPVLEAALLEKMLRQMVLIRRFEEACAQVYGLRKIGGFCHLYIGQEAVAVGAIAALDLARDYVLTGYRDHGHALACGMDAGACMAELFGKVTGCSRGKGGSMHLFDVAHHMYGGNGIVGGHIPVATGVGLKIRMQQEDGVVLCFFGDGAIHQGAFHESLNLAKVWGLPVIYICENNQYGMGTDYRRVSAVHDLSVRGVAYNIPGAQVDGMNVLTVYEAVSAAVARARNEKQPSLLEIKTYRYKGHSMSDPAKYRTKEEVEEYRRQDPILILQDHMTATGTGSAELYAAIDAEAKRVTQEALAFAEQSPAPALETMYEDIYA